MTAREHAPAPAPQCLGPRLRQPAHGPFERNLSRAAARVHHFGAGLAGNSQITSHDGLERLHRDRLSGSVGLDLDDVASQGYCFQVDLAWRAVQRGFRLQEVPITFVERELGASKMNVSRTMRQTLTLVLKRRLEL